MQQPLSQFSQEEIKKNSIVALYAWDPEDEDNHALPFFLGKVMNVFDNNENDSDGNESDKAPECLVKIHEYVQTKNNVGQPTGKYQLHT